MATQLPDDFLNGIMSAAAAATPAPADTAAPVTLGNAESLMREQSSKAVEKVHELEGIIDQTQQKQSLFQKKRQQVMGDVNAQQTALADEQIGMTQGLVDRLKPVFARRQEVATRLEKVAGMGAFEQAFHTLLHPSDDPEYLSQQVNLLDNAVRVTSSDYATLTSLQDKRLALVNAKAQGQLFNDNMELQSLDEDAKTATTALATAQQGFGFVSDAVRGESNLIQAKAARRNELLEAMTPAERAKLAGQAQKAGGSVLVDGVEIPAGELINRVRIDESQSLSLESQQLAIANQRQDLAEKHAVNLARSLTKSQTEEAIRNGGVYKGVRIPQDVLTSNLVSYRQRDAAMADDLQYSSEPGQIATYAGQQLQRMSGQMARARSMLGQGGMANISAAATQTATEARAVAADLAKAKANGAGGATYAALNQRMQATLNKFDTEMANTFLRITGGDKNAAQMMMSYSSGIDVNSDVAMDTMYSYVAKGALPAYMRQSPAARAAFQLMMDERTQAIKKLQAGTGRTPAEKDIKQATIFNTSPKISQAVVGSNFDHFTGALPTLAGADHPFGKFDQGTFRQFDVHADKVALGRVAGKMGVDEETAQSILSGNYKPQAGSPAAQKYTAIQPQIDALKKQYAATRAVTLLQDVDSVPRIDSKHTNSSLLVDFVNSSHAADKATRYDTAGRRLGFGDWLASNAAGGAFSESFGQYAQAMRGAQVAVNQAQFDKAAKLGRDFGNNPAKYTAAILGSIDGLDQHQEALILGSLKKMGVLDPVADPTIGGFPALGDTGGPSPNMEARIAGSIKSAAVHTKDPELKKALGVAAQAWEQHSASLGRALDRMKDAQ